MNAILFSIRIIFYKWMSSRKWKKFWLTHTHTHVSNDILEFRDSPTLEHTHTDISMLVSTQKHEFNSRCKVKPHKNMYQISDKQLIMQCNVNTFFRYFKFSFYVDVSSNEWNRKFKNTNNKNIKEKWQIIFAWYMNIN